LKTTLSIFTAILCLGVLSTVVVAGPVALRDPDGDGPGRKNPSVLQPRKQVQAPAKPQAPARTEVRPALKKTEPFKPLPGEDRKEVKEDMDPVK